MKKLLFRFFILCLLCTVIISFAIFKIYNKFDAEITSHYVAITTDEKYNLLTEYLKQYPENQWQIAIKKIQPKNSSTINILSIDQLPLTIFQIEKLKKGQVIYESDYPDKYHPAVIYTRINHTNYVFQEFYDFTRTDRMQRYVGWLPVLLKLTLNKLPREEWQNYLNKLSLSSGIPLNILTINTTNLDISQRKKLLNNKWLYISPNEEYETIYTIFNQNEILKLGPLKHPAIDTYETYFVFICALIVIEFFIFIIAILFLLSLEKLKKLAHAYSHGHFDNDVKISGASSLYSLYEDLKSMGQRIKKLLSSHKELTNHVSHELRTPISRLRFSLELLKESATKEEIVMRVTGMEEDICELEELVGEILTFSLLDRNQLLTLTPINLKSVLEQAISKLTRSVTTKEIITYFANENVLVSANKKGLLSVLQNLLHNANRFAKSRIVVSLTHNQIIIEDNGPGIADEDKENVFKPFFRADEISMQDTGYGLGLAIVKKIINQMGWEIWIEDSDLGGAKFIINYI